MLPPRMTPASVPTSGLIDAVEVKPLEIDRMSDVRHMQALSARRLAAAMLSEEEIAAFAAHLYSEGYSARLAEIVNARRLLGAWFSDTLAGTAGWTQANDADAVA